MGIVTANVSTLDVTFTQVGNNDPGGVILGPNTAVGANNVSSALIPNNAMQPFLRGAQAGVVTTYSTFQTAFVSGGVATITSSETGMTVNQGTVTSARVLITSGDMLYVNRGTAAQAGLGMGNCRVSASNVVGVTLTNWSGGTLTPTTNDTYKIVAIRGLPTIAATLTPASVAANATVEQQFTIAPTAALPQGIPPGALVNVMKPTSQAGLDIVGVRAVANNVIGITFVNVTAATITPTAAESYTIQALQPLDAANNYLVATINGGAVGAIAAGTQATGGTTAFAGLLATDVPIGAPVAPTGANNNGGGTTNSSTPSYSIITAGVMTMWFAGIGTGGTPTANVYWDQLLFRLNPTAPLVIYNAAIVPASVAANTTAEQTFTVTGLLANTPVWVNKPSWTSGLGIAGVRVSALNTLAINYANSTGTAIVPPAETYIVGNFQQVAPGATTSNTSGGAISQPAVNAMVATTNQVAAIRAALVAEGLISAS